MWWLSLENDNLGMRKDNIQQHLFFVFSHSLIQVYLIKVYVYKVDVIRYGMFCLGIKRLLLLVLKFSIKNIVVFVNMYFRENRKSVRRISIRI